MPLHPEALAVIEAQPLLPPLGSLSPAETRAQFAAGWTPPAGVEPVGDIFERAVPGPAGAIPVRVYVPEGEGPFPALVWLHGGGWVLGSLDENDAACRALCRLAETVVVSVDYRLAPEHPFPAAVEDCYAATRWVGDHGAELGADGVRLAVAGESAGGNLAAVTALLARDRGGPSLALQVLVSPVTGLPGDGRASYDDFADGYFLTRAQMDWFFEQYPRSENDLRDPHLAPLLAEALAGVCPALVLTAEYDVLRDEGEEYARRLEAAGVSCALVRYDGTIHGFFGLLVEELSISATAHAAAASALRRAFG